MDSDNHLEHFSLRWNNFNDNMKSGFHDLLKTEDFVDVTIAAEGKLIQAHKMVLSVCSPYFKNIFKTNPCQHPVIFLKDVTHKELSGILQFMYLGEVSIQQEELGRFLKTAEALQIKGLAGDDSNDSREEPLNETPENHRHSIKTKTKLMNSNDKESSAKRMKLSSLNYLEKKNIQTSPLPDHLETAETNENHKSIVLKTEPEELGISDEETVRVFKEESLSESFLHLSENNAEISDDAEESKNILDSSGVVSHRLGPQPGLLSGISSLPSESFVTTEGSQGLRYYPLLTKNQGLCPICGRILQHKKNLQTHIADQHSTVLRSWPCQICHKVCKTWSALRVHTNRHHTKLGSSPLSDHPVSEARAVR